MQRIPAIILADSNHEDSENAANVILRVFRNDPKCSVIQAGNAEDLLSLLNRKFYDIIVFNLLFPNSDKGMDLLTSLQKKYPQTAIIPVIPAGKDDLIKDILQLETFFYLRKPYNACEIEFALKRTLEKILTATPPLPSAYPQSDFYGIVGKSPRMERLFDLIARVAEDDFSTVLIRGDSGTGKELVAKAIHSHSRRRNNNFVPVNCAAIPDDLLESELFGHAKGAFTGATHNKIGRIQYADGGTLFLDEIGDMKGALQAKLLRVLQEKEFEPVGALKSIPVDTRILAATHCDLEQLVNEGKFREDLYYRLSVIPLNVPSLKDRKEDIPLLLNHFIDAYSKKRNREPIQFSGPALSVLLQYEWRGNVRELENFVQHMCVLFSGKTVERPDLPEKFLINFTDNPEPTTETGVPGSNEALALGITMQGAIDISGLQWDGGQIDFNRLINDFETQLILQALKVSGGNKKEAARLLKLKRTTLLEKIKKKELTSFLEDAPADSPSQ
jgi:DNA-binding NtrC family response regulator